MSAIKSHAMWIKETAILEQMMKRWAITDHVELIARYLYRAHGADGKRLFRTRSRRCCRGPRRSRARSWSPAVARSPARAQLPPPSERGIEGARAQCLFAMREAPAPHPHPHAHAHIAPSHKHVRFKRP